MLLMDFSKGFNTRSEVASSRNALPQTREADRKRQTVLVLEAIELRDQ